MTAADGKRAIYGLLAFVVGPATRRRLARWVGMDAGSGRPRRLAAFPPSFAAFVLALLVSYLGGRVATYGLFWDPTDPVAAAESWGGPSLVGAWIVHFFSALGMAVVCFWPLGPLTRLQNRLLSPVVTGAPGEKVNPHLIDCPNE